MIGRFQVYILHITPSLSATREEGRMPVLYYAIVIHVTRLGGGGGADHGRRGPDIYIHVRMAWWNKETRRLSKL